MSDTNDKLPADSSIPIPGYVCPVCHSDCSPIAGGACVHLFLVDGENGWIFTDHSRSLYQSAREKDPTLFRDLLYHDIACRTHLRLRRANYDDSLEMYVFSDAPDETIRVFTEAIEKF